ncbi:MAG: hypothetical protein ACYDAE_29175 [Steroidobacteraceae bacterium]
MNYTYNFPIVIGPQGLLPQQPASLLSQLTGNVGSTNPGYTANLPGSMIEDFSSTGVGGIALCDQAKVDLTNSLTPYGANAPLLLQLGQVYGVPMGTPTTVNVGVQFINSTPGYLVSQGTIVSDGTNSYALQATAAIATNGQSLVVPAIALNSAQTVVPAAGAVAQITSSIPPGIALNVTNPSAGNPAQAAETYQSYRGRVLQAGLAASVGTARFIKTLVGEIPGVVPRLIAVHQANPGIRVIVGGSGDPYLIGNAILQAVGDPTDLVGSAINVNRNTTVSLVDYPDTYSVLWVLPPAQTVTMTVTWNTSLPNFSGGASFPGLTQAPLAAYLNSLVSGQPVNLLMMNEIFKTAISGVLDPSLLTRLVYSVFINGVLTTPATGYSSIAGDPESYFTALSTGITVVQG